MATGIRTTNLEGVSAIDEVLANQTEDGVRKTVRVPVATLATQLAQSDAAIVAKQVKATFAQLDAIKATMDEGDVGLVEFDEDEDLRGSYVKSGGVLVRKGPLPVTVAEQASVEADAARDETVTARNVTTTARDVTIEARNEAVGAAAAAVTGVPTEEYMQVYTTVDPLKKLDLFTGFDGNPAGADWESNTYAQYMTGFDALFASEITAGDVVKTDRGACSDGVKHIFSYQAGEGDLRVLLVTAIHGVERVSAYAAMRWFQAFVKSAHPAMVLLRSQITVTFVPVASPWAWEAYSRVNFNGVDPNRNFEFYWTRFTSADPLRYKGTAAFSEPETSVLKTIVDEGQDCLVSCHNMGNNERPYTMVVKAPSNWVTGKRNLCLSSAEIWRRKNPGSTWLQMEDNPHAENPDEVSWFNLYNTWTKGKFNSGAILLESNSNLEASTSLLMTDDAAHLYCGHIDTFVRHWLAHGQAAPEPLASTYTAMRRGPDAATAMSAGGTQLNNTSAQNLTFDFFGPGGSVSQGYFDLIYPEPGSYLIMADGYFEGGATDTNITAGIETASAPNLSTWGLDNDSLCGFWVPVGNDRAAFHCTSRKTLSTLSSDNRLRVRMRFTATDAGGAKLLRCRVVAIFTPNHTLVPAPVINGL